VTSAKFCKHDDNAINFSKWKTNELIKIQWKTEDIWQSACQRVCWSFLANVTGLCCMIHMHACMCVRMLLIVTDDLAVLSPTVAIPHNQTCRPC